jgi:hypothetical protein
MEDIVVVVCNQSNYSNSCLLCGVNLYNRIWDFLKLHSETVDTIKVETGQLLLTARKNYENAMCWDVFFVSINVEC